MTDSIELYRITLDKIRSSKVKIKYRYRSYQLIFNNYVHKYGTIENALEELQFEFLCGKAMELSLCINNILVSVLVMAFCFNVFFVQTTYAAESMPNTFSLANTNETIEIEGISYTYNYFLENGKRAVTITNNEDNKMYFGRQMIVLFRVDLLA